MQKRKRIIDVVREYKEKHKETEVKQISFFDLFDVEDIVIKVRKKKDDK